jgi:uncharacterized RDD family membrane protein YckC
MIARCSDSFSTERVEDGRKHFEPGGNPAVTTAAEGMTSTPEVEYAGLWKRLLAFFVDLAIISLIFFAFAVILPILLGPRLGVPSGGVILAFAAVLWLVIAWLYWAIMESSSRQSTVGKDLVGILVTDGEGKRISFGKATLRYFGKIASVMPALAGFFMIGFTAKKQGLHDLISGSLVVIKQ